MVSFLSQDGQLVQGVKLSERDVANAFSDSDIVMALIDGQILQLPASVLKTYLRTSFKPQATDITNVDFAGGADPNGVEDSTDAIQAAVDFAFEEGLGNIYVPGGNFKVSDTIQLPVINTDTLPTVGIIGEGMYASRFVANGAGMYNKRVINSGPVGNESYTAVGVVFRGFGITGPGASLAGQLSAGIVIRLAKHALVADVDVFGCTLGKHIFGCENTQIIHGHAREAKLWNLYISVSSATTVTGSLYQVANPNANATDEAANVCIQNSTLTTIIGCLTDELLTSAGLSGASILIDGSAETSLISGRVYGAFKALGGSNYGVHIKGASTKTLIQRYTVQPFGDPDPFREMTATLKIESTVRGTLLDRVDTANYGSGALVVDAAPDTEFRNVDGVYKRPAQSVAYNAALAVNAKSGEYIRTTLTGNTTVSAPTNPTLNQELTYEFLEDGTGGWTVAWNAIFKGPWSNTGNTAATASSVTWKYDGTYWRQKGAQSLWA